MIKDIYIIKNRINNKVYIGQTVNPEQRWAQYKSATKKKPEAQLITKAMNKYGFQNFWMEILEKNVSNYDEREQYWIKQFDCIAPNGYNLAEGGQSSGHGIYSCSAKIKSEEDLMQLVEEIIVSEKSLKQLAQEYEISYGIINEINQGHSYYNPDLKYPLRESNKYSEEKIKQITYALKYELDKSLKKISEEYNCDSSFLNDINQGRAYFREYLTYPIRKGKMKKQEEYLPLLIFDLQNTQIPQKDLAKKYNISSQTVSNVNVGRAGKQKDIIYPIRSDKENGRVCFSPSEVDIIYKELKENKKSIRQIAEDFGVSPTSIQNINNGKTKKYWRENIIYPIRKK